MYFENVLQYQPMEAYNFKSGSMQTLYMQITQRHRSIWSDSYSAQLAKKSGYKNNIIEEVSNICV